MSLPRVFDVILSSDMAEQLSFIKRLVVCVPYVASHLQKADV